MKPAAPQQKPSTQSKPGILRVLGLFSIVGIVIGTMIGSGIFINPAKVAKGMGRSELIMRPAQPRLAPEKCL